MLIKNTERSVTPLFSTALRLARVGLFLSVGLALLAQSAFAQSSISAGGPMITGVSVYTGPRQTGAVGVFGVGTYAANDGSMTQIANDSAVSIYVPPGFRVKLCDAEGENSEGAGDCQEPETGRSELKWPRTASWIKVWSDDQNQDAKKQITGNVIDSKGKPIENASVKIKGTNNVTKTDSNGRFLLSQTAKIEQLIVSGTGYSDQEVDTKDKTSVTVNLRRYSKPGIIEITPENFEEEVINSDKLVVVVFGADWVPAYRIMGPSFNDLQEQLDRYGTVKFGTFNIDGNHVFAFRYAVESVPALLIFKNGKIVAQKVGAIDKNAMLNLIKPYM